MTAHIIGWAHSPFGKLPDSGLEDLIKRVAIPALEHAGLQASEVDAIFIGVFNNGMSKQDFPSSLVLQAHPDFRFKPSTRVENACATGSAALAAARNYIDAGKGRTALVVGAEKMTGVSGRQVGEALLGASYHCEESAGAAGFTGVFGQITQAYFDRFGDRSEALARIAAKNHANGVANPFAQLRRDLGFEFCNAVSDSNPYVAAPLRRTDCSPISDGAAAIILADPEVVRGARRAVRFRATSQINDFLPLSRRDITTLAGAERAWKKALDDAGMNLLDLDFIETHDCFTVAELMEYEAMGLTGPGDGHVAIDEGWTLRNGKLPVNLSGGLKAKGHPIGATGVSMHVLAAMQLAGEAGDMQLAGAECAGVFNMGGAGVANYVSILERAR